MKEVDGIIFDLDGTLWNASKASAFGWTKGLRSLGSNQIVSKQDIESVAGKPYGECVRILVEDFGVPLPEVESVLDVCEAESIKELGGECYPDMVEVLERLSESRPLFLVSNCQQWYLELFFNHYPVSHLFQAVDCHGAAGQSKTIMIAEMVKREGLKNAVYVGDTHGDQRSSIEAGVRFVHAQYGFGKGVKSAWSVDHLTGLLSLFV